MNTNPTESPGKADKTARVSAAVRSFSVIYNNSRVYNIDHPVFSRTVNEHMPTIEAALKGVKEVFLSFIKGQVRCDSILLDPGSSIFKTVAQTFESLGISGFCFLQGITAEEIIKFVKILTANADEITKSGLQKLLDKEGIKHIIEKKVQLDVDGKIKDVSAPEKGKPSAPSQKAYTPGTTFELGDEDMDLGKVIAETTVELPEEHDQKADRQKPIKEFVSGALADLSRKRKSISQVADLISTEFNERLDEKVEEVQKEKKIIVRRLENVKSVVFQKLEALDIIALLIDTKLNVLAMTTTAQALIGKLTKIPKDSPLAQCTQQESAFQEITLKGTKRVVQAIASETLENGESISLITLE